MATADPVRALLREAPAAAGQEMELPLPYSSLRRQPLEFRFGMVMSGGVSLAVYMCGVAQELLRLVRSGRSEHPEPSPYWDVLATMGATAVVDIISGTSAGGINGVVLAKALTCDADLEDLAKLWRDEGDMYYLLRQDAGNDRPESLLNGDWFHRRLTAVFQDLHRRGEEQARGRLRRGQAASLTEAWQQVSLVDALDLFVTATDLRGRYWERRDGLGHPIRGHDFAKVFPLRFRRHTSLAGAELPGAPPRADLAPDPTIGYAANDFLDPKRLATLGRITASYPVAFTPVAMPAREVYPDEPEVTVDQRQQVWLVDGGYLQNHPFEPTLQAIFHRAADRPVDRVLFWVDPSPPEQVPPPAELERQPTALEAALGFVELPLYQGIRSYMLRLDKHKASLAHLDAVRAVLRAGDVAPPDTASPAGQSYLALRLLRLADSLGARLSHTALAALHRQGLDAAAAGARVGRVRAALTAYLERTPDELQAFWPPGQAPAPVPAAALRALAGRPDPGAQDLMPHRLALLDGLDLAYHLRRLHGVLDEFARAYYHHKVHHPRLPALGRAEARLWGLVEQVRQQDWEWWYPATPVRDQEFTATQQEAGRRLQALLDAGDAQLPRAVHAFLAGYRAALAAVLDARTPAGKPLQAELVAAMAEGLGEAPPPVDLVRLHAHYMAWDLLLYPLATGNLGEQDPVEPVKVSPYGADCLVRTAPIAQEPDLGLDQQEALGRLGSRKLAGDEFLNFSGFWSARWRANDLMWGRLDSSDIILSTLVRRALEQARAGRFFDMAHVRQIDDAAQRARIMIYKEVLGQQRAGDLFATLDQRVALSVAQRLAVNRVGADLLAWLGVNADLLTYAEWVHWTRADQGAAVTPELAGLLADRIAATGWRSGVRTVTRERGGRCQELRWEHLQLLTWDQIKAYLAVDHQTGTEGFRDLGARVLLNTGLGLLDNARRLAANLVSPEKAARWLPAPVRWLGDAIGAARALAATLYPAPKPTEEADPRPSAPAAAAVAAAVTYVATYLSRLDWRQWLQPTPLALAAGAALLVLAALPGRPLGRWLALIPGAFYSLFRLSVLLATVAWFGAWMTATGSAWTIPFTAIRLTPGSLPGQLLAAAGVLLALWLGGGLVGLVRAAWTGHGAGRRATRRGAGPPRPRPAPPG